MADEKPRDAPEKPKKDIDRPQDPIVDRLKHDPAQPTVPTLTLIGFFGESDRPGHRRLYFTRTLDNFAEFRAEDVLHIATIPPEEPPFIGEQATRVSIRRDATVHYTRTRTARPLDEFDLDVKLRARPMRRAGGLLGKKDETLEACDTQGPPNCETANCETQAVCHTQAGCETKGETYCGWPCATQATCDTNCGSNCLWTTCETCQPTQCDQYTCDHLTCEFDCTDTEHNPSMIQTACPTCTVKCRG
jgi:hypothetical protein